MLGLVAAAVATLGAFGQETPLGTELQVNTYTTSRQDFASVASDATGGFVVVWQSLDQDGADYGVFVQRFSSAGAPLGAELQVNTYTTNSQRDAEVAVLSDGGFVVVWESEGNQDGASLGIFGRRLSSAGVPFGAELQVNLFTPGGQDNPSLSAAPDGDFVVAWESYEQDAGTTGVFARRFASNGGAQGVEFRVNTYTPQTQRFPAVAVAADGDFVVAWESYGQDGEVGGVFAQVFSSSGAPFGAEIQVNLFTVATQGSPDVAAEADGDFVVVWYSFGQDGDDLGVFGRRYSSAGVALAGEFQVNVRTQSTQWRPAVAVDPAGGFVVVWEGPAGDDSATDILERRYTSGGDPVGGELLVNTHTVDFQSAPAIGLDDVGRFVVAWSSYQQDGDSNGIFAQRFASAAGVALDVDGNGQTLALSDGLLVLRRFFSLTGAALTNGAVGANCTRCDAAAIEPYIAGLGLALDVDGNGQTQALTDGLLVVRYLFGLRDAALTSSAVGAGCTRCDAAAIQPHIASLIV